HIRVANTLRCIRRVRSPPCARSQFNAREWRQSPQSRRYSPEMHVLMRPALAQSALAPMHSAASSFNPIPTQRSVPMNRIASVCIAFGLAAAASTALAAKSEPVMMTDAQMDNVTAGDGGLITVNVTDALNNWNLDLALKVQANV